VDAGGTRCGDRAAGAWPQLGVLADQSAVEIAGERLDAGGEIGRENQPEELFVAWTT
jgi:hypothetical protein